MKLYNKIRIFTLSAVMLLSAVSFSSCSDKEQSASTDSFSGVTVDMDDLEYGATLRTDNGNYSLPMQFDKRFFDDAALTTLSNYYYSIQTNDPELFRTIQQDCYLNYNIKEVYSNRFTVEELVQASHDKWVEKMGGEYAYALIYVTDLITESTAYSNIPIIKEMLNDAAKVAGEEAFADKITTMYELTIDLYLTEADSGLTGEVGERNAGTVLYLYQYKDAWYVVY